MAVTSCPENVTMLSAVVVRPCSAGMSKRLSIVVVACYATVCSPALSCTRFVFVLCLPLSISACLRGSRGAGSPTFADPTRQAVAWHGHRHDGSQAGSCPEFRSRAEVSHRHRHGRAQALPFPEGTDGEGSGTGTATSGRRLLRSRFLLTRDRYHNAGGQQSGSGTAMGGRRLFRSLRVTSGMW